MSSSPVEKAEPGRPRVSAPGHTEDSDPIRILKRVDVFRGLTEGEYDQIAKISTVSEVPQDRVLPRAGQGGEEPAMYFVLKGQVAFAEFERGKVPENPKNLKKRIAPVMQQAYRNISLFEIDDFFSNEHVEEARSDDGKKRDVALYTCLPVSLLRIPKKGMDEILKSVPKIQEAVEARAEASYYRQTFLKLENRNDIFDFYLKQGFEYAQAIKIIQTDKCIDCDECVKGCEDRHGVSRIERFGPKLGLVQFTLNCRTCLDARCIEPCNFDAIDFDQDIGEVVVYDNCVGCTLCAKACPHEAIRMVDIIDVVKEAEQVEAPKKLMTVIAAGEEVRPKAAKKGKPKRIANKCDHCIGYSDLACISACPTGAIIQIDPRALFRQDGGLIERAEKYFDSKPFEQGYSHAVGVQGVSLMRVLFTLALIGVSASTWEYFARRWSRGWSLWKQIVRLVEGPEVANTLMLVYTPVTGFGRWLGYVGAGMMLISALYTLRLNVPGIRRIGNSRTWFDFHVVFGLAGPALSLLHTNLHIFSWYWVTFLWWAVFLVVATGLVGRYLYTALPKAEFATDQARKKLDEGIRQVADQWGQMTMSANVLQQFLKAQEKSQEKSSDDSMGMFAFAGWLVVSELRQVKASVMLRFRLLGSMKNAKLRGTAIKLMSRRAAIERRERVLGATKQLLAKWRTFHIAISIIMFAMLIAHIAISVWAMGWL